jgi:hypothetical protein
MRVHNNGRIDGAWNAGGATGTGVATDESSVFWQHVRLANLATGPTALAAVRTTGRAMPMAVSSASKWPERSPPTLRACGASFFICSAGVLGRYVKQIDTTMDDGNTAGGSVQAVATGAAAGLQLWRRQPSLTAPSTRSAPHTEQTFAAVVGRPESRPPASGGLLFGPTSASWSPQPVPGPGHCVGERPHRTLCSDSRSESARGFCYTRA